MAELKIIKKINMNTYPNYQIINHFTDTDTYKMSMMCAVINCFPRSMVKYKFVDRNNTIYPSGFAVELKKQLKLMENITITNEEIAYMSKMMYYMPKWFFTYLKGYKFNSNEVNVSQDNDGHLSINIEGYWHSTIMWEIPILAIISEMLHFYNGDMEKYNEANEYARAFQKAIKLNENGVIYANFGARRRFSFAHEDMVTRAMINANKATVDLTDNAGKCIGTSNIYFAMKYGTKLIGTMAHEFVSSIAGMYGPTEANYIAMDMWQKTFQGALGIYLYDTYTWKPFSDNFSEHFARCFAGLRVDSGNNEEQLDKIINKYKELGINPKSKQIVFSNAFTVESAIELNNKIKDKCIASFGIGTSLTGDVIGCKPSNIVIKLIASKITEKRDWNETCKMSEDKGKVTGNKVIVDIFKKVLHI